MKNPVDHHDAELLLRLYDLRREEKMRQARDWFAREFKPMGLQEFIKELPPGKPENAYFRMVVSYWDMAASIVLRGLINEEFFFENTTEFYLAWAKVKDLAPAWRDLRKNPFMWKNLEELAGRFEAWANHRSPGFLEDLRQRMLGGPPKS